MSTPQLTDSERAAILPSLQEALRDSQAARDHWQRRVQERAEARADLRRAYSHLAGTGEMPADMSALAWGTSRVSDEEQPADSAGEWRIAAVQGGWRATCRGLTGPLRHAGLAAQARGIKKALKPLKPYPEPGQFHTLAGWKRAEAKAAGDVAEIVETLLREIEQPARTATPNGEEIDVREQDEPAANAPEGTDTKRGPESPYELTPPTGFRWKDKSLDLPPLQWRLLRFGLSTPHAEIQDALEEVWGHHEESSGVTAGALDSLLNRFNNRMVEAEVPISVSRKAGYLITAVSGGNRSE